MTETMILGLLAETSLHVGAGQSAGVVDLPVAREGATGLPHIPDTGLKGALRQWAKEKGLKVDLLFGSAEADAGGGAGLLLISTARLLCLPVRRLDGPYAWVTTPYLLERLRRDLKRAGCTSVTPPPMPNPPLAGDRLLMANAPQESPATTVFLEEFSFAPEAINGSGMAAIASQLITEPDVASRIAGQAAIMSDEEFAWFAANALPVNARNQLDDSKMSKNLWYEETLPPDTLLYAIIGARHVGAGAKTEIDAFRQALHNSAYLQVGGNETVGQGWLSVKIVGGG